MENEIRGTIESECAGFHPCAIEILLVTPTRYRITYQHNLKEGKCVRCGESVDWQKLRTNGAKLDLPEPNA